MNIEIVETTEENKMTEAEQKALNERSAKAWQVVHKLDETAKALGKESKWKDYMDMVFEVVRLSRISEKDFNKIYKACGL